MFNRFQRDEEGFTLIELLVVVIIIGILAAVAIPTFLSQRERGWEAAAQSDLRNAVLAMESCATSAGGVYTGCAPADHGYKATPNVTVAVTIAAGGASFTATSEHSSLPDAGDTYSYASTTGAITGPA